MTAVRLNAQVSGPRDGAPLLLGGSLGTTLRMWDPQLAALARSYRVTCFEHRGHGASPAPDGPYRIDDLGADVLALMDRLELERASYCGLSLGAMVGQWLAINAPDRVARLILISTAAHLPPAEGWYERAAAVRQAGTPEVVADAVLARWFTPAYAAVSPVVVGEYRAMISSVAAEAYAGCCEAIAVMDLREGLARISAPTLVLAGAQDPATPPERGRALAGAIPGARLEVLDPGAHLLSVERADEVTRLICDHMEAA